MIGGADVILRSRLSPAEALDLCARSIVRHWREAVIQNATTGALYSIYREVPFGSSPEFMIYRDRAAFDRWEELEADPSNQNTMVHILSYKANQTTVVVDDPAAAEMQTLICAIRSSLQDKSIRMGVPTIHAEAA